MLSGAATLNFTSEFVLILESNIYILTLVCHNCIRLCGFYYHHFISVISFPGSQIRLSPAQPVWREKGDICSVRTLQCDKWRYRPAEAPLHVRRTNLLPVTLRQGFTDDSSSPSIRQKSSESWKQFESACLRFNLPLLHFSHLIVGFGM